MIKAVIATGSPDHPITIQKEVSSFEFPVSRTKNRLSVRFSVL
jgi:hypothetical protein